jgi:hypothetical protein
MLLGSELNLSSVPDECSIIRLGRIPKDFQEGRRISAIQMDGCGIFELSSQDKASVPPHLSVWVDTLTTPDQAYKFLPLGSPLRLVLRLKVKEVRSIVGHSKDRGKVPNLLDVIWVHLEDNTFPGYEGHAGITGLDKQLVADKILRKDLRFQLAELAEKDCFLLD